MGYGLRLRQRGHSATLAYLPHVRAVFMRRWGTIAGMAAIPKRRWFQFSLRTLLLIVTILAVGPGGWLIYEQNQARRNKAAAELLRKVGGEVYATPRWLWTLIEPGSPGMVVGVGFRYRPVTDSDLEPLSSLTDLVWLDLNDTPVGDDGLVHLAGLSRLKRLRLDETQITDTGLAHLSGMTGLQQLNLYKSQITDAGLVYLTALTNLEELNLQRTQVTAEGAAKLQKELPKCKIVR